MEIFGKQKAKEIAFSLLHRKKKIEETIQKCAEQDIPTSMKSAWILSTMEEDHTGALDSFVTNIIRIIPQVRVGGTKRELIKCLLLIKNIESEYQGLLVDQLLRFIISPSEDMAVRYNSMKVMRKICKQVPELKAEFHEALKIALETTSPTFQKLAKTILKDGVK